MNDYRTRMTIARVVIHLAALSPFFMLVWDFTQQNLSANPIREIQLRTGWAAINLLMASLACKPINIITGFKPILAFRRSLGIYAFIYMLLHFINFIGVDYSFNITLIREDLFEKRYAIVGFASFLLLLPLALTSIRRMQHLLGKTWQRLHMLVYPAAILAVVHYIWQTKVDIHIPLIYGGILALFLAIRIPIVRNLTARHHRD